MQDYISCGVTEIKSENFRIQLESAEYFNSNEYFNYAPAAGAKKYLDLEGKKYCLGGGWNDGAPK